jgi:YVTN family beta-propeller protein
VGRRPASRRPPARRPPSPAVRRRRALTLIGLALLFIVVVFALLRSGGGSGSSHADAAATATAPKHTAKAPAHLKPVASPLKRVPPGPPSDQRQLTLLKTIGGHISPKSVAATDTGLVFAQNMMYTHTDTVYDSSGKLVKTIPDTVDMSKFGIQGHPGITHGAPVEAAVTPDAKYAYVSNYSMYGSGFGPEGSDTCTPSSAEAAGNTDSYVYRISTSSLSIDQVIKVGLVPKFLTVTPDGKYVLVANWCSFDLSVINVAQGREVARLPMGAYPRGLAVSPNSKMAYVAVMGSDIVTKVDLTTLKPAGSFNVGPNPRHLVISPDGRYLYASLNASGEVAKLDVATEEVVATQHTGTEARSLAISADGRSLYVVNYASNTVTKLRASDLSVLQDFSTGEHPIGITYDASTGNVWVAVYSGQIMVLADRPA